MPAFARRLAFAIVAAATAATLAPPAFAQMEAPEPQIINGKIADHNPGAATLILNYSKDGKWLQWETCSSTVVADQWILTAKHCLANEYRAMLWRFTFRVGSLNAFEGGQTIAIDTVAPATADLLLVHLKEPIKNPTIVKLASTDPAKDSVAQVFGWGATSAEATSGNDVLKSADVKITGTGYDNDGSPALTSAAVTGQVWKGDSGGPMFFNGEQVGVASTASPYSMTASHSSVAKNLDWIKNTLKAAPPARPNQAPMLVTPANQQGRVGVPFSLQLSAPDEEGDTVTFTATDLPEGLSIDNKTGLISGTPTKKGVSSPAIQATDAKKAVAKCKFDIVIDDGTGPLPTTSPTASPTASPTVGPTVSPTLTPTVQPTTTAPAPSPTATLPADQLANGVAKVIKGSSNSRQVYQVTVPSNATKLSVTASGGRGMAALHVRKNVTPTLSEWDCRDFKFSSRNATCNLTNSGTTTYYVMVYGLGNYDGAQLVARWS